MELVAQNEDSNDGSIEKRLKQASKREPGVQRGIPKPGSQAAKGQDLQDHNQEPKSSPIAYVVNRMPEYDGYDDSESDA